MGILKPQSAFTQHGLKKAIQTSIYIFKKG